MRSLRITPEEKRMIQKESDLRHVEILLIVIVITLCLVVLGGLFPLIYYRLHGY